MVHIEDKAKCCGCSACAQICPQHCVSMEQDQEGFTYPQVDGSRCIHCNLCEKVCPELNEQTSPHKAFDKPEAYGGWNKEDAVRAESSSGGIFTLFARYILSLGGSVYGCVLGEKQRAVHVRACDEAGLAAMRGSKYVQSDMEDAFAEVWNDLENGLYVLFTGTPCQAAGLRSYLSKKIKGSVSPMWERLFVCDFICHGVPSPAVFQSYIKSIEEGQKDSVVAFRFRLKDKGWNPSGLQLGTGVYTKSGKALRNYPAFRDTYMNGFLSDLYLRPSCHDCHFKYIPKDYADVTIADFWGVDKEYSQLMDGKGTSLVLIHNTHGQTLFDVAKEGFAGEQVVYEKAIRRNQSLIHSAKENAGRKAFFKEYETKPFSAVQKKYMKATNWFFHRLAGMAWSIFEKIVRGVMGIFLRLIHVTWSKKQWDDFFQLVKFCVVGVSNAAVSYLINVITLLLLRPLYWGYDYIIANIAAFLLSVLWSFYWNSKYVFPEGKEGRSTLKLLLKMYMTYGLTGIILNNVLGTIWIKKLGISKFIAPLLNIPITVGINFVLNKFWTFKK